MNFTFCISALVKLMVSRLGSQSVGWAVGLFMNVGVPKSFHGFQDIKIKFATYVPFVE